MKQILIVEDDELLNKMLVYNLQSESYGIVSVETVKEAMEVLKSQPLTWYYWILIFLMEMDMKLQKQSGINIVIPL